MKFVVNKPIILASESPRRQELLDILGVSFDVIGSDVVENEEEIMGLGLTEYAKVLAIRKAKAVAKNHPTAAVIGADTIVGLENKVYPKPSTTKEAKQFLQELSGQEHVVVTAVAVATGEEVHAFAYETKVTFYELDDVLIDAYIATGDPLDKAGAYGIQSGGAFFVKEIQGDYYAVMGLPIAMLRSELQSLGILSLDEGLLSMTVDLEPKMMIRDVHLADRPRERLIRQGAESLSNQELVAILLRTGTREESVLVLANRILSSFDKIQDMKDATIEEYTKVKGVGQAKAVQLLAAAEIGKRMYRKHSEGRYTIRSPEDAAAYLMTDMSSLPQEHFVALFLNVKNEILHKETIFIGSLNSSIVHPRELFREAVKRSAASIICAHNHPSGNPTPSPEDIEVTKRLTEAGAIMGIELLDHLIIGDHQFISLKEKGYM